MMPSGARRDAGEEHGATPGSSAALASRLLQDMRSLMRQDRQAAIQTLASAARLVGQPADLEGDGPVVQGGLARWQMKRLIHYVEENLDKRIMQQSLAGEVRLSAGYFNRAFKQSFGCTAHAYVIERRIDRAKKMMLSTRAPLCDVALACGMADQSHFSRLFRQTVGTTPLAWRRQYQAQT